jgi:hypothetical protein
MTEGYEVTWKEEAVVYRRVRINNEKCLLASSYPSVCLSEGIITVSSRRIFVNFVSLSVGSPSTPQQRDVFCRPVPTLVDRRGESEARSSPSEHEKLRRCLVISFVYWGHFFLLVHSKSSRWPDPAYFHSSHQLLLVWNFESSVPISFSRAISSTFFHLVIGRTTGMGFTFVGWPIWNSQKWSLNFRGKETPTMQPKVAYFYTARDRKFVNTNAELNFQTFCSRSTLEAVTTEWTWVKARGLRDRNPFLQRVRQGLC